MGYGLSFLVFSEIPDAFHPILLVVTPGRVTRRASQYRPFRLKPEEQCRCLSLLYRPAVARAPSRNRSPRSPIQISHCSHNLGPRIRWRCVGGLPTRTDRRLATMRIGRSKDVCDRAKTVGRPMKPMPASQLHGRIPQRLGKNMVPPTMKVPATARTSGYQWIDCATRTPYPRSLSCRPPTHEWTRCVTLGAQCQNACRHCQPVAE